ncbi:MAG: sulfatase-like hydrolase/transferase [Bacteroidales bacterium]
MRRPLTLVAMIVGALLVVVRGAAPPPNVLLITLDTVRADHLGAYGSKLASTPALDRLAREGVRFTDATTHAPLTGPAHAGILTGVYPARFGVRDNASTPLPPDVPTLATVLRKAGYSTGAFIGAFILDRAYGFDHGFEEFDSRFAQFQAGDKMQAERPAGEVLKPALAWLAKEPGARPFFAWVHFYDAHAPYAPPEPYKSRYRSHPYDGEIAYVDSAVARLLQLLEQRGVLDRTLVVAVADHGEGLGDHGEEEHGLFLYDSTLHIPWVMRLPARAHQGLVVRDQVRAIDVMPTILDIVGVPAPPKLDGETVLPRVDGSGKADAPVSYAETYYPLLHFGWSAMQSARVPEWKYISAPRSELYDLRKDPAESANVIDRQSGVAGRLDGDMRRIAGSFGSAAANVKATVPDADTLARLRSLGYVGFTPSPAAGTGPDPKDMAPKLAVFRRLLAEADAALKKRNPTLAIEKMKQALVINERAYDVHILLGDAHAELRDYDRAVGEYAAAALLNPDSADPLLAAAGALLTEGRFDQAREQIERAARLEPRSAEVARTWGRLHERQGLMQQAFADYQEASRLNPSDVRPRAGVVNMALQLKNYDAAAEQLKAMAAANYDPPRTHYALGIVAEGRGDKPTAAREYRRALALDPTLADARAALQRVTR